MAPGIPAIIGQGWEKQEFKFEVNVLPNIKHWQSFQSEPQTKNKDQTAVWSIQSAFKVSNENNIHLCLSRKILCPERKHVFATVYICLKNPPSGKILHSLHQKYCYPVDYEVRGVFTWKKRVSPLNFTMFVTIISETGPKPGFTDILLSGIAMKMIHFPCEKNSLTMKQNPHEQYWSNSCDHQDLTGNSRIWIGKWEKFMFVFDSLKPQKNSEILPSNVISKNSKWLVKLKPKIVQQDTMNFLVTVRFKFPSLPSHKKQTIFAKVMYVVDYKGKTIKKFEHLYCLSRREATITYPLNDIGDVQNTVVKVSIVSDTGKKFHEVHLMNPPNDGLETKNKDLDSVCATDESAEVSDTQEKTRQKRLFSPHSTLAQSDTFNGVRSVNIHTESDPVDKDQLTKEQELEHQAKGQVPSSDLNGKVTVSSCSNYGQSSESQLSDEIEVSEPWASSSSQQDKQFKTEKTFDNYTFSEIDIRSNLPYLEEWNRSHHKYSVPTLERFLYLYSIRMVTESNSIQQYLCRKSEPQVASSLWNIKMESSFCSSNEVNVRIAATLMESKTNVLFAQMFIFTYCGMDQDSHSFEKKQCLCVGESIVNNLQIASISTTTTTMVEILIMSEDQDRVFIYSCKHDIDAVASSDESSTCHVFIQSSSDVLESDSNALSDCSPLLQAIIQNFGSDDQERVIRMTDFSSKVVQSMIAFIDGAEEVCWKRKRTEQIFKLSNKYGISELKDKCELHLMTLLNITNALDLLIFATDNQAEQLRNSVLELLNSRHEYFSENHRYSILCSRPEIMQQLLEYLGDCRTSNRKRKNDSPAKEKKKRQKTCDE